MARPPTLRGEQLPTDYAPLDPGRVDLLNPLEVQYWCREFGCTDRELQETVARVGNHAAAVREQLSSRR